MKKAFAAAAGAGVAGAGYWQWSTAGGRINKKPAWVANPSCASITSSKVTCRTNPPGMSCARWEGADLVVTDGVWTWEVERGGEKVEVGVCGLEVEREYQFKRTTGDHESWATVSDHWLYHGRSLVHSQAKIPARLSFRLEYTDARHARLSITSPEDSQFEQIMLLSLPTRCTQLVPVVRFHKAPSYANMLKAPERGEPTPGVTFLSA
eukprot:Rhum_TRINITY_DN3518_c0_g1::Rhum_TRINITY_DN3518_c0_g1_i1::g.11124::m.11124